jgi:hypothetical protein
MVKLILTEVNHQPHSKARLLRIKPLTTILVIFLTISIVLHSLISRYFLPKAPLSAVIKSESKYDEQTGYPTASRFRPCKAPILNSWSELSEDEVDKVLQIVEKRRTEMDVRPDATMYVMMLEQRMYTNYIY